MATAALFYSASGQKSPSNNITSIGPVVGVDTVRYIGGSREMTRGVDIDLSGDLLEWEESEKERHSVELFKIRRGYYLATFDDL